MKQFFFTLVTLFSMNNIFAASQVSGYWSNNQYQLQILVEDTNNGIKVKRSDQERWYYYEKSRYEAFIDREGNIYELIDENTLQWRSNNGEKRIKFHKNGNNGYRSEDSRFDNNYDDSRDRNNNELRRGQIIEPQRLQGVWQNFSTGQRIQIKARRDGIRVKARNSNWVYFDQKGPRYVDRKGNTYIFRNGTLTYFSERDDFMMKFRKR